MKEMLILSLSNIESDPRVLRQISSFEKTTKLTVAGYSSYHNERVNFIQLNRPVRKTGFNRSVSQIKTLGSLIFRRFGSYYWITLGNQNHLRKLDQQKRYDIIVANDFDCAPLALALNSKTHILDAHEYTPDENYLSLSKLVFSGYKDWLCRSFISRFSRVFTVSDGIAERYSKEYGVPKPELLLNAPQFEYLAPSLTTSNEIRLVHHGIAVKGRGIENIVILMEKLPENFSLYFHLIALDPDFYAELVSLAAADPRIRFEVPVPTGNISQSINKYDIGIFLAPPLSVNHEFTLPNKFFEFIQGRLMVAITPSKEMELLVRRYNLGVIFNSFDIDEIALQLKSLSIQDIMQYKNNSNLAAHQLNWENQNRALMGYVLDY